MKMQFVWYLRCVDEYQVEIPPKKNVDHTNTLNASQASPQNIVVVVNMPYKNQPSKESALSSLVSSL